jgi:hypothetical protein
VAEVLAKQPRPETDKATVEAIVSDALARQPKPAPMLAPADVRSIVTQMLAEQDAKNRQNSITTVASLDPSTLDPMIENYLLGNPRILQRMTEALDKQNKADQALHDRQAIPMAT